MKRFKFIILVMILIFGIMGCKNEAENIKVKEESSQEEVEMNDQEEAVVTEIARTGDNRLNDNEALFTSMQVAELKPLWNFPSLELSNWSIESPLLKPFIDEGLYEDMTYDQHADERFKYVGNDQMLHEENVSGSYWRMTYQASDDISDEKMGQFVYDLIKHYEQLGVNYLGRYDDKHLFKYEDQSHWWLYISEDNRSMDMTVMKEEIKAVNEKIVIKAEDYPDDIAYFSVDIPEGKYISLETSIDGGSASINFEMDTKYGTYERDTEFYLPLDYSDSDLYIIDSFIYEPGRARVVVEFHDDEAKEVALTLHAKYDIQAVEYGENLGGILLDSDMVEGIIITPTLQSSVYMRHPEYSDKQLYFDKNQENAYVTFVPSGYYDLEISVSDGIVNNFKTLRVPVHAGKMTHVDIPESVTNAFKQKQAFEEKGIFISDIKESNNQVSFVFSLLDKETKDVLPSLENSDIYEGGMECQILSIEAIEEPMEVVLLLDSSGSMKGHMEDTIEATKTFIESLPDNAIIKVVDFDTEAKPFTGQSKETQLKALDHVKAKGATALYDSVYLGLDLLRDAKRPSLIVFTDGEDANLNDTARGSKKSLEETLSLLEHTNVPLYTIGFGEGHDSKTLEEFSKLTQGKYYPAQNQEALSLVFKSINDKLSSTYKATYKRPVEASISDIPVVSLIVDISGSMDGTRIIDVKNIIHNFVETLPDNVQIMVTGFSSDVSMYQGVTTDRLLSLNAVGSFDTGGGTNINDSVIYGYESLSRVNSSKRIMIYITDAALDDVPNEEDAYKKSLKMIKEEGIETLWIGMGVDNSKPFENVANFTEGHYIVTEDVDLLSEKFSLMLESVKDMKESTESLITLNVKKRTEEGAYESFSKSEMFELSPIKKSDQVVIQDTIHYSIHEGINQYDNKMSHYISGESTISEETIITKRIPADVTSVNEALKIHVEEIVFSSKLYGVEAPYGQRFMGVLMDLENILKEQEVVVYPDGSGHPSNWVSTSSKGQVVTAKIPYVVPNFSSHFGMSFNGEGPYPASTATWLTAQPIVVPGEYDITLGPDEIKKGMMVFIVPDQPLDQLGIHYFDDNYGHFNLAVVNEILKTDTSFAGGIDASINFTDMFDIAIKGHQTVEYKEDNDDITLYRNLEGAIQSEIKANLNLEPKQRFFMRFKSDNGDFYSPLSKRTSHIPFGLYAPTTVMPGAENRFKMLYQIPNEFVNFESDVFIDLYKEDKSIPVISGDKIPANIQASINMPYFKADVNNVYKYEGKIGNYYNKWAVADVTIHDIKDDYATRGVGNNFYIGYTPSEEKEEKKEQSASLGNFNFGYEDSTAVLERGQGTVSASDLTSNIVFALDGETIIYDGSSRRGIILFDLDESQYDSDLYLKFDNSDMSVKVSSEISELNQAMTLSKEEYEVDNSYAENLERVLPNIIKQYKLKHPEEKLTKKMKEEVYDDVSMPSVNVYGYDLLQAIKTEEDLIRTIRSLRFVNQNENNGFTASYSKEALLTQGFGTEADMANLSIDVLSRQGYKTGRKLVKVTDKGLDLLRKMSGIESLNLNRLPAVSYQTSEGNKMLVLPFARDISDLSGLVYYDGYVVDSQSTNRERLTVSFDIIPNEKGRLAQLNDMSGALGGSSSDDEGWTEALASFDIPLEVYSQDPIDVGIAIIGKEAYVYVDSAQGTVFSEAYIDLAYYDVHGWSVEIDDQIHHVGLEEDMLPDQVFMTIAYNLPELPSSASLYISDLMKASKDLKANTLAAMKWIHRQAIYNFIASQTSFERALDESFDLVTGRIERPRMIVVQSIIDEDLTTSMDLVRIQNELHTGQDQAHKSYKLMSGISASQMESKALHNGIGLEAIWAKMPEDAYLVLMDTTNMEDYNEDLVQAGVSEEMINYFDDLGQMVIIQSQPSVINGKERWAWLEINPYTFETISVIDTFEHGTMASNASLNSALEKAQYFIGAFKGVETSVWSVSTFSLQLVEYKEIIKAAKAFALGIGGNFEAEVGSVTLGIGKKASLNGSAKDIYDYFKKGKKEEDSKGFKEGYIDGVNFYFEMVGEE